MRLLLSCLAALAAPLCAQKGDEKDPLGTVQDGPPAWMVIPAAPPLAPAEAMATFRIEPGYRIELVASEPFVEDPVSIRFDAAGRMWVVEMRTFMPDADGKGEDAPLGRIAVLEDQDGDGRMDRRTTFLDGLAMPRAVLPLGAGAALVLAPPHFVLARDTDGDLVADEQAPIGVDFENGFSDPEHAANSPAFGLDNWIHVARFDRRLRARDGAWQVEKVAFGGQWGQSMDDQGRWFFNTNSDHLRAHFAPPRYEARNPALDRPAFANQQVGRSQEVWPIRVTPGVNRGYKSGTLRPDGTLAAFTAVCGPCVYRGDLMPELAGDVFVVEPAAQVVRREAITEEGTALSGANAYADREFMASTDERFRPVDVENGPDGALYVVDMYRGLIQHRNYLTSYLRRQVDERGLALPIHMGRIWRIVPDRAGVARQVVLPAGRDDVELVGLLSAANGWVRDTAQRLLVDAGVRAREVAPALRALARTGMVTAPRLHALWTLEGIGALDRATVMHALRDPDAVVREHAVQLAEPRLRAPVDTILLGVLCRIAAEEAAPRVAMQLAFTFGAVDRGEPAFRDRAERALADLLARWVDDPRIRDAAIGGLAGVEVRFAQRLCAHPAWATASDGRAATLARLSGCVVRARDDGALRALLALGLDASPWQRRALLDGVAAALPRQGARKIAMTGRPAALDALAASGDPEVLGVVARIDAAVDFTASAGARPLSLDEEARFDAGAALYAADCTQCHQPNGRGMDGLAPPLDGSEWVLGPPDRLARIVLHGLTGPIEVAGRSYDFPTMPDHRKLGDADLAAVLTYVRRAWDNAGEPVDAELVRGVREAGQGRTQPWTAAELR